MIYRLAFVVVPFLLLLAASGAEAQTSVLCSERKAALATFESKYDEQPAAQGVGSKGYLFDVLTTADGRTWTILATEPGGLSCVVATGVDWNSVEPEKQQQSINIP